LPQTTNTTITFFRPAIIFAFAMTAAVYSIQSCTTDKPVITTNVQLVDTPSKRNVIVILIDGPRWSETFGDSSHQYMPEIWALAQSGVWCSQMYNTGITNTINGISHITTGMHSSLINTGTESPSFENLFQRYNRLYGANARAYLVASKDKLDALKSCSCAQHDTYLPLSDCGIAGNNTGYRDDSTTFSNALHYMAIAHPQLSLIAFKEPDAAGHSGNWAAYLQGIRTTSAYVDSIIRFLETDISYAHNTDVFVTNDHGRHLDGIADGFVSHGDACDGCRHISLIAYGPDFKQQFVDSTYYDQRDITATIAEILRLGDMGSGKKMTHLLQ
jgi:membrane-anchored protein YejM (alkaline phosphatase superfamily)